MYDDHEALNMIAPQGFVAEVSTFPYAVPSGRYVKSIYVGTLGDVVVTDLAGNQATFVGVQGWLDLPIASIDAGTTASDVVVLFVNA